MDQTLLQKIANHYVTLYLAPKEGQLLDTKTIIALGNDLESLLGHHLLQKNETTLDDEHQSDNRHNPLPGSSIMSNPINYVSLYRYAEQQCTRLGKSSNSVTRLQRLESALKYREINTYGDLVISGQQHSWLRHGNIRDPFRIPNLGPNCLKIFYSFLNHQGVQIFNTPYRIEELV